jgi:hypothetical protein
MTASRKASLLFCLLMLGVFISPVLARRIPLIAGEEGLTREIDRRSHPVITRGWDAIRDGRFGDPILAGLPALTNARILQDGGEWVLIRLGADKVAALEAAGVRMSMPRPRPSQDAAGMIAGRFSGERAMRDDPPLPALSPLQSLAKAMSVDSMMSCLDAISVDIATRYYRTGGMQQATQYAYDRLNSSGCDNVYYDTFTYNGYSIRNVVGVKTGVTYPDRLYMICGHLDSTSPQRDTLAPGAEDNGSGAVAVLEAARLLARIPTDATIYFVCFTAEEQGMIGSGHLATIADQQNWDLRGVLNMDMVGYDQAGSPDLWVEGFHANAGSVALMDLLESVANTYTDMDVYRYPGEGWGSDHEPFNSHGFPAVLAIDYNWEDYACYHQTCDVIANVVPNQFRRMAVAVTVAGAQLAGLRTSLGSIAGTTDRTDSHDDAGVRLEVPGTQYDPVVSGPNGSFTIPDLLPGTYYVRATADGYQNAEARVDVIDGQVTNIVIPLDPLPGGGVTGTVSLQGGGSPLDTRIFAEGQAPVARAAFDGSYSLEPVRPGNIVVSAVFPGRMPTARVVNVPSGQVVSNVDFSLEPLWNFESTNEGLIANAGWQWGTDSQTGAHSGSKVWGTRLNANYESCADYKLDLPVIDLRFHTSARLHFWHWYRTEAGYDGGNVRVSTDQGATWTVVSPLGGYPGRLSGSCNPLSGQLGYCGSQMSWTEAIIDLNAYVGRSVRVRLSFGANSGTNYRGWYVDDFSLEGSLLPADVAQGGRHSGSASLADLRIAPNPFVTRANVFFYTGAQAPTWITIFDAAGRRVRAIVEDLTLAPGDHSFVWDGRDDRGRRTPAGMYWVRVFTSGRTVIRPVVLLN